MRTPARKEEKIEESKTPIKKNKRNKIGNLNKNRKSPKDTQAQADQAAGPAEDVDGLIPVEPLASQQRLPKVAPKNSPKDTPKIHQMASFAMNSSLGTRRRG